MAIAQALTSVTRSRAISDKMLFAATFAGFVIWELGGHVDVWYHQHYGFAIESFVTWPHALLYVGWVASAAPAAAYLFESRGLGLPRSAWLPPGYALVLAGAAAFGLAGGFDLVWHSTLGFEVNHEALVSPSHLGLISSAGLGYFGLLWITIDRRSRARSRGFAADLAVAVTLGILFRHALYALHYAQPFATDYASGGSITGSLFGYAGITAWQDMTAQVAGTTGIVLYAVLLSLFVVVPLRQLRLGTGALTVIVLWNEAWGLVGVPEMWPYLPAVIASAIVCEGIWSAMALGALGGRDARSGYWLIGAALPWTLFVAYFALMATLGGGITWSTPLWAGAPVLAGLYGLVVAVFAIPPRFASADIGRS